MKLSPLEQFVWDNREHQVHTLATQTNRPISSIYSAYRRAFKKQSKSKVVPKNKISLLIRQHVDAYRKSHASLKQVRDLKGDRIGVTDTTRSERAFQMQMDRASGALDVLFELVPKDTAWADTGWIQ